MSEPGRMSPTEPTVWIPSPFTVQQPTERTGQTEMGHSKPPMGGCLRSAIVIGLTVCALLLSIAGAGAASAAPGTVQSTTTATTTASTAAPSVERCSAWNRWCAYTAAPSVERCSAWNRWCAYTSTRWTHRLVNYLRVLRSYTVRLA